MLIVGYIWLVETLFTKEVRTLKARFRRRTFHEPNLIRIKVAEHSFAGGQR